MALCGWRNRVHSAVIHKMSVSEKVNDGIQAAF